MSDRRAESSHPAPPLESRDTRPLLAEHGAAVAMAYVDGPVATRVEAAIGRAGLESVGLDALETASTVVAQADQATMDARISALRSRMRAGAALVVVAPAQEFGAALRAGASACVPLPVEVEELVAAILTVNEAHSAKMQVASLTKQLDDQQPLVSVGRVSAGLAHEIGSPLSVAMINLESIELQLRALRVRSEMLDDVLSAPTREAALGRLDVLRGSVPRARPSAEDDAMLHDAHESLQRIADLMRVMKNLVGGRRPPLQRVSLRDVCERVIRYAARSTLAGISVERAYDDGGDAFADARLVEQVLTNLFENAAHALKGLRARRIRVHVYAHDEQSATLSVRDNGPGIDPELHEQIFEPFFTTRRGEGGTGLGLALCREYARQMGGALTLWSEPGRGACFRLTLRRAAPESRR